MIEGRLSQLTATARRLLEEQGLRADVRSSEPLKRDARLSFAQERIWIDQQLAPYSSSYNCALLMRVDGSLDAGALSAALRQVIERHPPLHSVIVESQGSPHWRPASIEPDVLRPLDLSDADNDAALAGVAAALMAEPFDLTQSPPVRVYFGCTNGGSQLLVLVTHHIAWDGASTGVFFRELEAAYRGLRSDASYTLPPLPAHFEHYVAQKRDRSAANRDRLVAECEVYFADMPGMGGLPPDFKRIKLPDSRGKRTTIRVGAETRRGLEAAASGGGGTLFHGLLALTAAFIARQSGADEIAIAVPVIDRSDVGAQALIGLFLDTVVVRVRVAPERGLTALVRDARDAFLNALELRDLPLGDVLGTLAGAAGRVSRPTIGVLLTLDQAPASTPSLDGAAVSLIDVPAQTARFDFGLSFVDKHGELQGRLEFAADLYSARSVDAYTERLERFITAAARTPDVPVGDLPMLSVREKRYVASSLRGPRRPAARDPLAQILAAAQAAPDAPAISDGTTTLSYREMVTSVRNAAAALKRAGVGEGDTVALVAERHARTVIGVVAAWYAGAAVAPIDPQSLGSDRLVTMLRACGAACAAGAASALSGAALAGLRTVDLDAASAEHSDTAQTAPPCSSADAGAYVMFTSGSTGTPKPVRAGRKQLAETLAAASELFAPPAGARVLWSAALTFDIAFLEIFLALTTGGCCVLHAAQLDLTLLAKQMEDVNVFHAVPTVMNDMILLAEQNPMRRKPTRPEVILVGGEAVTPKLLQRLCRLWPTAAVSVLYGPTEATIICSSRQLRQGAIPALPVIGSPHRNVVFRILEERGTVAPTGVPGQLSIGGATVVRGYAAAGPSERFASRRGSPWFLTGDRVRLTWEGDIEYLGRLDHQEKIRGVRVEPALVENTMRGWVEIADVVVGGVELPRIGRALVAYAIRSGRGEIDAVDVRERLALEIDSAAIPAHIMWLESFPTNRNGKVNRAALAALAIDLDVPGGARGFELEQTLACLWRAVLGRSPASPDDSFYALGGDSLGGMRLLAQIRRVFSVSPAIDEILLRPTLRGMARAIVGDPLPPLISTAGATRPFALTAAQREMREAVRSQPRSAAALEATLRIGSEVDVRALRAALSALAQRHDALRMRIPDDDSYTAVATIGEPAYELTVAVLPATETTAEGDASAQEYLRRHRADAVGPTPNVPLHVVALQQGSRSYVAIRLHVLAGDTAALNLLLRELADLYTASLDQGPLRLPVAPSFSSYADGEAASASQAMRTAVDFWTRRLTRSDAVPVRFGSGDATRNGDLRNARIRICGGGSKLQALATSSDTTEFAAVLSLLALIAPPRASEQFPRIAVRTANRGRPGSEALVARLENTIFVDIDTRGELTLAQLANRTLEALGERYVYDGVARSVVTAACASAGLPAAALDTRLLCSWKPELPAVSWDGTGVDYIDVHDASAELGAVTPHGFELVAAVGRAGDDLVLDLAYDGFAVSLETVERIAAVLELALTAAAGDPELPAAAIAGLVGNVSE